MQYSIRAENMETLTGWTAAPGCKLTFGELIVPFELCQICASPSVIYRRLLTFTGTISYGQISQVTD